LRPQQARSDTSLIIMTNQLMERISQLKYQIPRIIARQKEKEKRKTKKGKS
jgi:hypothetical protein